MAKDAATPQHMRREADEVERRSGKDRRRTDLPMTGRADRRRGIEPRQPEVAELDLTDSQWGALQQQLGSGA
jgi:hypothetical protein